MNVSSAGPLLCVWLNRKRATESSQRAGLALAWSSFWLLPAGIVMGLILGVAQWKLGERDYAHALTMFRSKAIWGVAELVCSLGWTWCYWAWLRYRAPQKTVTRFLHAILAVLTTTNLQYHFPPLMVVMSQTANGTLAISEHVDAAAHRHLVFQPQIIAQTLHVWTASLAVSGVYLFWLTRGFAEVGPVHRSGARLALVCTLAQIGSGIWLIAATPRVQQLRLLGEDWIATLLLIVSMLATFSLQQQLAAMAFGDKHELLPKRAMMLMLVTVVSMTGVL